MNNIVIVEDRLKRGISLAEQFEELAEQHPEWGIQILAVCYFNENKEAAMEDIKACVGHPFTIRHVSLWDFDETMDEYTNPGNEHTIVIIDFFLDGDGSSGIPVRRVNIRYAKRADENRRKQLWFYTGTGFDNNRILCELVGKEHVLQMESVGDGILRLNLEDENFRMALLANSAVGA